MDGFRWLIGVASAFGLFFMASCSESVCNCPLAGFGSGWSCHQGSGPCGVCGLLCPGYCAVADGGVLQAIPCAGYCANDAGTSAATCPGYCAIDAGTDTVATRCDGG
jgi:hypothetical protein